MFLLCEQVLEGMRDNAFLLSLINILWHFIWIVTVCSLHRLRLTYRLIQMGSEGKVPDL